jgi:hypothetical protein
MPYDYSHILTFEQQAEVREHVPKIVAHYITRLEHLFMVISNGNAQDPVLKRISKLVNACNRILDATRSPVASPAARMTGSMMGSGGRRH